MVALGNDMMGSVCRAERLARRAGERLVVAGTIVTTDASEKEARMPDEPRPTDRHDEIASRSVAGLEADVEGPTQAIVRRGGTFAAFRHRDYMLFWSGALVSNVGSWMQMFALSVVVYALRRSESDLGIINGLSNLPVLFLAIPAGLLADRVNRRTLLIWAQVGLGIQALVLGWLYASGNLSASRPVVSLAIISALGLIAGLLSALTFPAWQSMVPDLVPRDVLLNGIALNAAQFQSARLLGPLAAAGVLLVGLGMGDIFYINAASFIFVIAALAVIRTRRVTPERSDRPRTREGAWRTLTAGLAYARENRSVGMLIASVAMMTVFGMPYMMLLPALVDKALVPAAILMPARDPLVRAWTSYVMSANGLGALAGALIVASLPRGVRREPLVRYTLLAMALLLVAFALSRTLWLTIVISTLTGAAFLTSTSLMNTSIQACVPHELRGRVMALFVMAFMGLMPVSSLVFGPLGSVIGPMNAVIVGAVALAGYSLVLIARPRLLSDEAPAATPRG
jgi:MFS family permease